jgi:hypothetical protein
MRVFENTRLRIISWHKWEELAGEQRRLHNEELMIRIPQVSFG